MSLKNAQILIKTKKILDYSSCSMQAYMDEIKPLIVNLYHANKLPLCLGNIVLQNLAGTMNDAFESVCLSKIGNLDKDMDVKAEYNTVISALVCLTTVYTDELQSSKVATVTQSRSCIPSQVCC